MNQVMALAVVLLASAQAAPDVDLPAERSAALRAALARADAAVAQMGACTERRAGQVWEDRYQWAFMRLGRMRRNAQGIYGPRVEYDAIAEMPQTICTETGMTDLEDRADRALGAARDLLARDLAAMRGLWMGSIRLCGGRVERATTAAETLLDPPGASVILHFSPAIQPLIALETGERVGQPVAIRLDGRIVQEPMILEPLRAAAHVTVDSHDQAEQIRQAALRACDQ